MPVPPAPHPSNATPAPYRFHAFEVSYFSAKLRPALRYKQLWVEELRADLAEIHRRTGLGFIPVLITPEDDTWQDTSDILDRLEARHPQPPLVPATPAQRVVSYLVELYADEFAVMPAMQWRWGTPEREAFARARFVAMTGSEARGHAAADAMVKRRDQVGVCAESAGALEAHTFELLDALNAHFAAHAYLLGDRLSLADCALMGFAHGHLFTDQVSRRMLLERAVPVVGWIERCNVPNTDAQGEWLAHDAIAATLREVLRVMGRDAAPVILACLDVVERLADAHVSERRPPRGVGTAETTLRGAPLRRFAGAYTLYMLQRVHDAYHALAAHERAAVDAVLAGTGFEALIAYAPRHRVGKRGFELVFEEV